ncbi:MAG TPA: hypothetical protein VER96_02255 [Polyangiaceae bacterium]|nr:hypothetical protein [Polyangiaceae bacterium]
MTGDQNWLLNCIALVRRAPGTWVPTKSARGLELFLIGYRKARNDLGFPEYGHEEADLLEPFQVWAAEKVGLAPRVGWAYCVEQLDNREENVLTFVSLFEEFLSQRGRQLPVPDPQAWIGKRA